MSFLLYHRLTDSCGIADVWLAWSSAVHSPGDTERRQEGGGKVGRGAKVIVLGEWYF